MESEREAKHCYAPLWWYARLSGYISYKCLKLRLTHGLHLHCTALTHLLVQHGPYITHPCNHLLSAFGTSYLHRRPLCLCRRLLCPHRRWWFLVGQRRLWRWRAPQCEWYLAYLLYRCLSVLTGYYLGSELSGRFDGRRGPQLCTIYRLVSILFRK